MQLHRHDLTALMRAANAGDAGAYRTVLALLADVLRAHARRIFARYGRGTEDVEDVVQDTLLAIHLKRHTWNEERPLEPWARAIAGYKLVDHLRRRGFREHVDIDDVADTLEIPQADVQADAHDCSWLLSSLPERQRRIVEGMTIEGRSAREVGDTLGMTEGAVRVALHRALKSMAALYRRELE